MLNINNGPITITTTHDHINIEYFYMRQMYLTNMYVWFPRMNKIGNWSIRNAFTASYGCCNRLFTCVLNLSINTILVLLLQPHETETLYENDSTLFFKYIYLCKNWKTDLIFTVISFQLLHVKGGVLLLLLLLLLLYYAHYLITILVLIMIIAM